MAARVVLQGWGTLPPRLVSWLGPKSANLREGANAEPLAAVAEVANFRYRCLEQTLGINAERDPAVTSGQSCLDKAGKAEYLPARLGVERDKQSRDRHRFPPLCLPGARRQLDRSAPPAWGGP